MRHLPEAEEDEDPFGYAALGFDDGGAAGPNNTDSGAAPELEERALSDSPVAVSGEAWPEMPAAPSAHPSHALRRTAHIAWCGHCGRHAAARLGKGLIGPCRGSATGAYPARTARLLERKHPISGEPI